MIKVLHKLHKIGNDKSYKQRSKNFENYVEINDESIKGKQRF